MRPQCSVFIAMSLDGFIARPDGRIDWLSTVEEPGEDYGYRAFFDEVDTVVLGRKTYDVVLGVEAWSYNGKRVVVLTHAAPIAKHGEEFFSGRPRLSSIAWPPEERAASTSMAATSSSSSSVPGSSPT